MPRKKTEQITVELTPRLLGIAYMLLADKSIDEIALELGISPETAANHKYAILRRCVGNHKRSGDRLTLQEFVDKVSSGEISLIEYLPPSSRILEADKAHIIKLMKMGHTISTISQMTGFSAGKIAVITRQQRLQEKSKNNQKSA